MLLAVPTVLPDYAVMVYRDVAEQIGDETSTDRRWKIFFTTSY